MHAFFARPCFPYLQVSMSGRLKSNIPLFLELLGILLHVMRVQVCNSTNSLCEFTCPAFSAAALGVCPAPSAYSFVHAAGRLFLRFSLWPYRLGILFVHVN